MLYKIVFKRYGVIGRIVNVLGVLALVGLGSSPTRAGEAFKVLALGDSLTAGYGLAGPKAFPRQLEAALRDLGHHVTIINGGVSGDTSAGGRSRLDWLVDGTIDAVIIELGANDGMRGLDPASTRQNIDWIIRTLKAKQVPILLTGMLAPPNLGADYGAEFNAIYSQLATQHGIALDPFFLQGVVADPTLNQADGLHPNAQGVAVIVKRLVPQLLAVLKQKKRAP
ncbi:MAG: arylesterase [Magnetovibrio sp.]|nr:arylesterase [Magnetovibrio sp.]